MENYLRAMDWLYRLCIWISGISIIIMSIVIPWGVYARKFLNRGAAWPEPIAVFCMVIFTFFGAAACYRGGRHISVQTLADRLPPSLKKILPTAVNIFLLLISLFMIFYGFRLCLVTWNQSVDTLPALRVGVTYLPLPLGSLALLLFIIEQFIAGAQHNRPIVVLGQEAEPPVEEGRS